MNKVILIGKLTRDVDCKLLPNGTDSCRLNLECNRSYRTKAGKDVTEQCFIDIETYGNIAEEAKDYMVGQRIVVEGRLKSFSNGNGIKHSIMAEKITLL